MSVVRIYPIKDTFIVSEDLKYVNTGLDEILEVGLCKGNGTDQGTARALLDFDWNQIPVSASKVLLHLTVSTAYSLKENTTVQLYDQNISWSRGTGHLYDIPNPSDGATWEYPTQFSSINWSGAVASGSAPVCEQLVSGSSLIVDLTEHYSTLHSIVLKLKDESTDTHLSYFSSDTHTIYRPYVEILTDDSVTGEDLPETVADTRISVCTKGLKEQYKYGDTVRVDLGVRPQFPKRTFSTSSLYLDNYILPTGSYWGIEDEYTRELAIQPSIGTKLSADTKGNYFMLNTGLLEPERFYRIIVTTNLKSQNMTLRDGVAIKIV